MNLETFSTLLVFAIVVSITPGPNNVMIVTTAVNFGFRRTLPVIMGVFAGFYALQISTGLGLGTLLIFWPQSLLIMKIVGTIFLVYLAYRLAVSKQLASERSLAKPMSFVAIFFFQWVNPKAVLLAISMMSVYVEPQNAFISVLLIAAIFSLTMLSFHLIWAASGTTIRKFIAAGPTRVLWFNRLMALLLVGCVGTIIAQ